MSKEKIEFEIGSGNVFKDLGFPNPEEELMKARFAAIIPTLRTSDSDFRYLFLKPAWSLH